MDDYGERLRRAKRVWDEQNDPEVLSWAEIARRASEVLGRRLHPETVLLMKAGRQEPTVAEFRALAQVLHVTPAYLAFGQLPFQEAGDQPPVTESYGERIEDSPSPAKPRKRGK